MTREPVFADNTSNKVSSKGGYLRFSPHAKPYQNTTFRLRLTDRRLLVFLFVHGDIPCVLQDLGGRQISLCFLGRAKYAEMMEKSLGV